MVAKIANYDCPLDLESILWPMFTKIMDHTSPLGVENILRPYKRGEAEITPEVCRDILRRTNFARNIKDMLGCVAALPAEKQAAFKDVVPSVFSNREQPNDILVLGKKLAVAGGYEAELGAQTGDLHEGTYYKSEAAASAKKRWVFCSEDYSDHDFAGIDEAMFLAKQVNLNTAENLPEVLDVSGCSKVDLSRCGLAGVKELRFAKGTEVVLFRAYNLPKDLDVSMCSKVFLSYCDLAGVKELRFAEGAVVCLNGAKNLPEIWDVSKCFEVLLHERDLTGVKELRFAEGAKVYLDMAKNLPEILDVSKCAKVGLSYCDLAPVKELRFAEGAEVCLNGAYNLPADLDVSMCSEVDLIGCDLASVKKLRFKNQEQMKKSNVRFAENWSGKTIFTDRIDKRLASALRCWLDKGR